MWRKWNAYLAVLIHFGMVRASRIHTIRLWEGTHYNYRETNTNV